MHHLAYQARSLVELVQSQTGLGIQRLAPGFQRHRQLLQCTVARPFADPINGNFDLCRAAINRGKAVGYRQAQIVMAVSAVADLVAAPCALPHPPEHLAVFIRQSVADRIRQIDDRRSLLNNGFNHFNQIVDARARGIHCRKLHRIAELAGISGHFPGSRHYLGPALAQLMAQMNVG